MLRHPALHPEISQQLSAQRCVFHFGNTAPDVQVVSGQTREDTHFFTLPIDDGAPSAWEACLSANPSLSRPAEMPPARAAFVAGYLCHLLADWLWVKKIFAPVFGPEAGWGSFRHRLYLHNGLRAYLDVKILEGLLPEAGFCIDQVIPKNWLPFVEDRFLVQWLEFVYGQLQPGAAIQTVEVFANRQGISPTEFYRLIQSEDRMDQEIFSHVSRERIDSFRSNLLDESIRLLNTYLVL